MNSIKKVSKIQFSIWNQNDILKNSVCEVTSLDLYSNNEPKFGGLFDPRMGVIDAKYRCETCHLTMKDCPGHHGHILLSKKVYLPHFLNTVLKTLQCVCYVCGDLLVDKNLIKGIKKKSTKFKTIHKLLANKKKCINPECCEALQPKWTKDVMMIYITEPDTSEKQQFTAEKCHYFFDKLSDEVCECLGFDPKWARPEDMICSVLAVPPPSMRPSVMHGVSLRSEGDLTCKLLEILKANKALKDRIEKKEKELSLMKDNEIDEKKIQLKAEEYDKTILDCTKLLQYHVITLIDNDTKKLPPAQQRSGRNLKSIKERLGGKEGRFRGNLMGKRVNFSARTVITGDPRISVDELGVPMKIAMNLTYPEVVNKYNIEQLKQYIKNGPTKYPGAKFVIKGTKKFSLEFTNAVKLDYGDVVERHLIDGDRILFNRQPSLHKHSMMSHKVKVMPYDTFRLNVCVTSPYNADFDGDEMNMHVPQSIQSVIELEQLTSIPTQIVGPQSNKPVIGCIQDILIGARKFTDDNNFLDKDLVMHLMNFISTFNGDLPKPINGDLWSGKQVFSLILPKINYFQKVEEDDDILVENGIFKTGKCNKKMLGTSPGSLVHIIWKDYGPEEAKMFLNNISHLINQWLFVNGFSVGITDTISNEKIHSFIEEKINEAEQKSYELIMKWNNTNEIKTKDEFENKITNILNIARDVTGSKASKSLDERNRIKNMVNAGSKGSAVNIAQIMACVGQQALTFESKSSRVPYGYKERTLPHFTKYNDEPLSRGFIRNSYIDGLQPEEYIFHAMSGRQGIIDTSVKTSSTGYVQRRLVRAMEDVKVKYDFTVRNSNDNIIQFLYGNDNFEPSKLEFQYIPYVEISDEEFEEKYFNNEEEFEQLEKDRMYLQSICKSRLISPVNVDRIVKRYSSNRKTKLTSDMVVKKVNELLNKLQYYVVKNNITKQIINFATKNIKIIVREKLCCNKVINVHKIGKSKFEKMLDEIYIKFMKSIIHPGEMVGPIAAQSIGEKVTQLTLNSFHNTGISSKTGMTRGVPRLNEIIDISKNPKTPSLTIFPTKNPKQFSKKLSYSNLLYFCDRVKIYYDADPDNTVITEDKEFLESYYKYFKDVVGQASSPWVLRIEINKKRLFEQQITMMDIYLKIVSFCKNCQVIFSHDNYEKPVFHIRNNVHSKNDLEILKKLENTLMEKIISGTHGINSSRIRIQKTKKRTEDGSMKIVDETVIDTEGTNLKEILTLFDIEKYKTISNDINEVYRVLGVEAARQVLIDELKEVIESNGIYIDVRHYKLLADVMTNRGYLMPINRHGMKKSEAGPMTKASFEETVDQLTKSAVFSQCDHLKGVTANIMIGQQAPFGTGECSLSVNERMLRK